MNDPRALLNDIDSQKLATGLPNSSPKLQVSSSALNFDPTELGEESFLTLKITPPRPNTLIVISINDASVFQVAVGIERLAYKQALTFKPEQTGSYVHLRYTPERAGRHQATLSVELPATAETIRIPMTGRTIGMALPAVKLLPAGESLGGRSTRSLTTALLLGGLVVGLGYTGYVYRCDLFPSLCTPASTLAEPTVTEEVLAREPVAKEPVRSADTKASNPTITRPVAAPTNKPVATSKPVVPTNKRVTPQTSPTATDAPTPVVNVPAKKAVAPREEPVATTRKEATTAKPATPQRTQPPATAPKPAAKTTPTEESELERVLNRGSN